jgi:GTPase SAR1 family protein
MSSIYKGAHGVILLYDVSNPDTLGSAPDWLKEIQSYSSAKVVIYLVGTKTDLDRKVSIEQGQGMAAELGIKYYEVSAKTGGNVDSLFCKIINDLKEVNALSLAASSMRSPSSSTQQHNSRHDSSLLSLGNNGVPRSSSAAERKKGGSRCCVIQ